MDESVTAENPVEAAALEAACAPGAGDPREGGSPAISQNAPDTAATTGRSLDLNELQKLSGEDLASLAREFDLRPYSARSRHYQIVDLIRAALQHGATVTAQGFLDQVGDWL